MGKARSGEDGMTVTKQTTLRCNHCKKEVSFIGEWLESPGPFRIKGENKPPMGWYKIDPNYQQSLWSTADYSISGDFCSLECMRDYIVAKIDSPKDIQVGGFAK